MFTSDPSNMMQRILQMGAAGGTPSRDAMMSAIDPSNIQGRLSSLFAGASGDQSKVMEQVAANAAPAATPTATVAKPASEPFNQPAPVAAQGRDQPSADPWTVQFEAMSHDPFGAFAPEPPKGMY